MIDKEKDREQVALVLSGNKQAYSVLVDRYKDKVYGMLRGMGAGHQDAQDLTQEAFIKAYRKLASLEKEGSFAAWILTIAANAMKDRWKQKLPEADGLHEEVADHRRGPEDALLDTERRVELQNYVDKLPANYRMVLLLRYTNELSYEEISRILGVPVSKVQNDLYRAKQRLKQWMTAEEVLVHEVLDSR